MSHQHFPGSRFFTFLFVLHEDVWQWLLGEGPVTISLQSLPYCNRWECLDNRKPTAECLEQQKAHHSVPRTEKLEVWWASAGSRGHPGASFSISSVSALCHVGILTTPKCALLRLAPFWTDTAGNNFKGYMLSHLHSGKQRGLLSEALLEKQENFPAAPSKPLPGFMGPSWVTCPSPSQ